MIEEIPLDFAFKEHVTLDSLESGIRAIEGNVKVGLAVIAVSLGRVRREKLYLSLCRDFKTYCRMDRFDMSYDKLLHLSIIGENWWNHREALHNHDIRLSEHMSKVRLLTSDLDEMVRQTPLFYQRFKDLSYRELRGYIKKQRNNLDVQAQKETYGNVTATQRGLYINGVKVRGIDMKDVREKTATGKRAVVFWVEDDGEARKLRRSIAKKNLS